MIMLLLAALPSLYKHISDLRTLNTVLCSNMPEDVVIPHTSAVPILIVIRLAQHYHTRVCAGPILIPGVWPSTTTHMSVRSSLSWSHNATLHALQGASYFEVRHIPVNINNLCLPLIIKHGLEYRCLIGLINTLNTIRYCTTVAWAGSLTEPPNPESLSRLAQLSHALLFRFVLNSATIKLT